MHHHFIPRALFDTLRERSNGSPRLVMPGLSMTLDEKLCTPQVHLDAMDLAGIDTALVSYAGLNFLGVDVCRQLNDGLANLAREFPGRFVAAAHGDPSEAGAAEIRRAVTELGCRAVALPTSMDDSNVDDACWEPLWQAAEDLQVPVFLHPALLPRGADTTYALDRAVERFTDTSRAAVRIMRAVTDRHPDVTYLLSHCGGTFGVLKGRVAMFYEHPDAPKPAPLANYGVSVRQRAEIGLDVLFEERFRRFFVDTAGTGGWSTAVTIARDIFGADRMVFGTDYPLEAKDGHGMAELLAAVQAAGFSPVELGQVTRANARKLLGLDPVG